MIPNWSEPQIECTVELDRFTFAPVTEGETVGYLVYRLDGEIIAKIPITASYSVERIDYKTRLWEIFKKPQEK